MTEIPLQQHIAPNGEPMTVRDLASCPPPERWNDWMEIRRESVAAQGRASLRTDSHHLFQLRSSLWLAGLCR